PQRLVVGRLAIEHLAHGLRRALFAEEFPRLVAHLLLFVGEIEIHGATFLVLVVSIGRHSGAREARARNPWNRRPCGTMDSGPAPSAHPGMTNGESEGFSTARSPRRRAAR